MLPDTLDVANYGIMNVSKAERIRYIVPDYKEVMDKAHVDDNAQFIVTAFPVLLRKAFREQFFCAVFGQLPEQCFGFFICQCPTCVVSVSGLMRVLGDGYVACVYDGMYAHHGLLNGIFRQDFSQHG